MKILSLTLLCVAGLWALGVADVAADNGPLVGASVFAESQSDIDIITRIVSGPGALGLCGVMIWLFSRHLSKIEENALQRESELAAVLTAKDKDVRAIVEAHLEVTRAAVRSISTSNEVRRELIREFRSRPCLREAPVSIPPEDT